MMIMINIWIKMSRMTVMSHQITSPVFFEDHAHRYSFQPNLRTCASFAVTSVTGFTSTAVRANGILAERFHLTNWW